MKQIPVKPENKNIQWVEELARLMDNKFRIPGTNFRFGLDPILGLIPFVGDAASLAISGGLVLFMVKYGASRKVIALMTVNIILDATIGSIPIIGSIFDFFYKANTRNIRLVKEHYEEGKHQGGATGIIVVVSIVLITIIFGLLWGLWELIEWVITLF